MILITSIVCMALVYYFMDTGLAIGFITAVFIEIFSLIALYNILKNTEQRVRRYYESMLEQHREQERKNERFIKKVKEFYPDIDSVVRGEKTKETDENSDKEQKENLV
ncbi:MAG: hypothetical protein ACQEQS_04580 [Thermodesulfobacteriota bacterium]